MQPFEREKDALFKEPVDTLPPMTVPYCLLEGFMFCIIGLFYYYFSTDSLMTIHNLALFIPCVGLVYACDKFCYQLYLRSRKYVLVDGVRNYE